MNAHTSTNAHSSPLISRTLDQSIAYLTSPLPTFDNVYGAVTVKQFLTHVQALAAHLPKCQYAINLCGNRYLCLVSFCAVLVRGQTNLLPPNKNLATQNKLNSIYPDCITIHDGIEIIEDLDAIDLSMITFSSATNAMNNEAIPSINMNHLAAISFTSGSTGDSKPNLKYWHTLKTSSDINYRHMIPTQSETLYQLTTVPAQHMWGLETSILLPLFHNICTNNSKPLFPQDIIDTLKKLPKPRMLVSTPVHLRALNTANNQDCELALTLCATSPLTQAQAQATEDNFSTQLYEVYGCSEVGSMAIRRTANQDRWTLFEGITLIQSGKNIMASADHLPETIQLQDTVTLLNDNEFLLSGRMGDMVDIAGKRGSLLEFNQALLNFPDLIDGTILFPDKQKGIPRLVAIVALKNGATKKCLRGYFQKNFDSAFVPRPIFIVEHLPREENGKLSKKKIETLYSTLLKK